jgi:hypothetical protein
VNRKTARHGPSTAAALVWVRVNAVSAEHESNLVMTTTSVIAEVKEGRDTMSEDKPKKKYLHASVSARVLYALTPLLKHCVELAHSDYAFMSQMQTQHFGCYLLPAEKGVVVIAVESATMLAIKDEDGSASEPLKVTFPNEMLDVLAPRVVVLRNENGMPFEVESEPKADRVLCSDGFGIVFLDKQQSKKFDGCLGTWFNGDHGNVIDEGSYRLTPTDAGFIAKVVEGSTTLTGTGRTVALNPWLLAPIAEAARRMGTSYELTLGGESDPVALRSADDSMFGLLMPMKREERGPSPLIDILTSKANATSQPA